MHKAFFHIYEESFIFIMALLNTVLVIDGTPDYTSVKPSYLRRLNFNVHFL